MMVRALSREEPGVITHPVHDAEVDLDWAREPGEPPTIRVGIEQGTAGERLVATLSAEQARRLVESLRLLVDDFERIVAAMTRRADRLPELDPGGTRPGE
jgi:hypothetical protein